jgi:hypothetical protein
MQFQKAFGSYLSAKEKNASGWLIDESTAG